MLNPLRDRAWPIRAAGLAALFVTTLPSVGVAQSSRAVAPYPPPETVPTEPHETPVPAPAWARLEPLGNDTESAGVIVRDRFTSLQVNVNPWGENEWGDAANEPSIAIDPTDPNRMVVAWRHFSTIESNFRQAGIAYSDDGGFSWIVPSGRVLDPGQFRSDPVLAADNDGVFYYSSLSSLTSVEVFASFDGGLSWPRITSAFGGDKQWLAVDRTAGPGAGNLYQLWNAQFSCCAGADFTRSVDGGATFERPIFIPSIEGYELGRPKWGTIDVGYDGTVYVVGATLDQTSHVFARSRNAKNANLALHFDFVTMIDLGGVSNFACMPNPAGLLGQVWVATDHSWSPTRGNVYVLGSVEPLGSDPLDVHLIRSSDQGASWSTPIRINDDPIGLDAHQWFATMSVAPNGRIDVVWNDTRADPNAYEPASSELYYSYSLDGGTTWSVNEPVTPPFNHTMGYPRQNKIGDYYHMVSDNGGGNLAYAATFNGEQDVFYVRVTPDCNGNGMPDELDVADGVSSDCNGNFTPDECEPATDCNTNGIPDICEAADNLAIDCNRNAVPDECEIADGSIEDADANGVPDVCQCDVDSAVSEPHTVRGSRYLSFVPGNPGRRVAVKVTLIDSAVYPHAVGASWWVDSPRKHIDSAAASTWITVAGLTCAPVYHDWGDIDLLHVFGDAVVPDSSYEVRVVRKACLIGNPASYSPALRLSTGHWGDIVEPYAVIGETGQPDFHDVGAVILKFVDDPRAVSLPVADLHPAVVDQLVDFQDVAADVSAFMVGDYPFGPPSMCRSFGLGLPEQTSRLQR